MNEDKNVYRLQGLTCMSCAAKFEKNIREIQTVEDVQLNFGASKLAVYGDVSVEQLEKAGAFDGIKVYPENQKMKEEKIPFWKKRENKNTMVSLFFLIFGYLSSFTIGEESLSTILIFALSIVIGGYDLFKVGLKNLTKLQFDMKTLMTVAIIGAAVIGEWGEGAVVVFLFALSEALESYSMDKARQSIRSLMDIAPDTAMIKRGNKEFEVAVEDIQIGDIMIIKPGQKVAMDGEVVNGQSSINQAAITGESIPVHKQKGDEVFAGSLNEEGFLEVRVTKRVEDTTIAKIIHLVEEAQAERAPSQQFVDKFAKYYTPAIMVVALLVALIPPLFLGGEWSEWIYRGLAVLVVGCPCALVISTPVAIVTAIGNAARKGVLIKGGIHLEETGRLKVVAFDKTGTLTEGKPEVTNIVSLSNTSEAELLAIAAAIEKFSQHPLASAILRQAKKEKVQEYTADDFQSITGKGAKATISDITYFIGSPKMFQEMVSIPTELQTQITDLQLQGKTVMLIGTQSEMIGYLAVADQVRKSSLSVIQKLKELGITNTVMLTGDNQATGKAIGTQLGLSDVKADLMPQDKLEAVKSLREQHGKIAMIGDGINDAPALATATVGIAMGGAGTDAALETADIALMADDLEKLPYTIALSRKTLNIIKQNVSFALGLKLLALLLIVPGWLTLWLAIFADMGATLIVVLNSLRLMKTKYN
ncbi:heavy metal translocating P-type ATPase [Bacillus thermotolerans]|uniref:Cd(2+)-exporting ATPase n=1 Tax=Bacillus thermotolerans TaxID=1221996 RepID=A0A0F5HMV3_BACTR|nr:heavy metal translocating P-type ATPase [Bacillus thermotolerans]KKB34714.1 Lead, cadmium, zinc and mercury transporting ATPase [Bacillus thermotolerans]KKB38771.1 Lead, cadmium, zinc and mercury transporting ATPase [Bacillus thermotolerans]